MSLVRNRLAELLERRRRTNEVDSPGVVGGEKVGGLVAVKDEMGKEKVADGDHGDIKEL